MKQNPFGTVLVAILFLSALATAFLATRYFFAVRNIKKLQAHVSAVQQGRQVIHALAQEALDYSKRDPSINDILVRYQIKTPADVQGKPSSTSSR